MSDISAERQLEELESNLCWIPEPTRVFSIGDVCEYGSYKDVVVVRVLHDAKIYEIDYTSVENKWGKTVTRDHLRQIIPWTSLFPVTNNTESFIQNSDLRIRYLQQNIMSLRLKAYNFGVDMSPSYQRDYVWEEDDKVALIHSIFCGYDVGKFAFVAIPYDPKTRYSYEIVDGKQRMEAILGFREDRFRYKGLFYSELSVRDKHYFDSYPINVAELDTISERDKLRYFIMLNTAGKVMDKEHIRKVEEMVDELS